MLKLNRNHSHLQEACNYLSSIDTTFKLIIDTYGYPPHWQRNQGFETLCQIIIEQQVSLESAKSCYLKLKKFLGDFSPINILNASDESLRNCSLSRQKASYLKALATAIHDKKVDIDSLADKEPCQIREELIQVKGIGHWTIDVYLIFCIQSPNIFPMGDIAVINTIKELWPIETKEDIHAYAKKWEPHLTTATFLLWHYYLCKRGRTVVY